MASLYETDYYLWATNTAKALREGRVQEIELIEVAEEIEDLGKSQRRALENRLLQLLVHLLKWDFQPSMRSRSWQGSINSQRIRIKRILAENPSLAPSLASQAYLDEVYKLAVQETVAQTNLSEETFPAELPYTLEFILSAEPSNANPV